MDVGAGVVRAHCPLHPTSILISGQSAPRLRAGFCWNARPGPAETKQVTFFCLSLQYIPTRGDKSDTITPFHEGFVLTSPQRFL